MYKAIAKDKRFVIEEDSPEVGWYLYVYDKDDKCIYDCLQDTLEICMEVAREEFGVIEESWKEEK